MSCAMVGQYCAIGTHNGVGALFDAVMGIMET